MDNENEVALFTTKTGYMEESRAYVLRNDVTNDSDNECKIINAEIKEDNDYDNKPNNNIHQILSEMVKNNSINNNTEIKDNKSIIEPGNDLNQHACSKYICIIIFQMPIISNRINSQRWVN